MASMKLSIPPESFIVNHLFDDSKLFLGEAKNFEGMDPAKARTYIRASVITAFAALEALVNTFLYLLDEDPDLELHERAFVQEERVELAEEGYFEVKGQQFRSLEQKIRFLHWRGHGTPVPKDVWKSFREATKFRNNLVHPKPGHVSYSALTTSAAKSCLIAVSKLAQMLGGPGLEL